MKWPSFRPIISISRNFFLFSCLAVWLFGAWPRSLPVNRAQGSFYPSPVFTDSQFPPRQRQLVQIQIQSKPNQGWPPTVAVEAIIKPWKRARQEGKESTRLFEKYNHTLCSQFLIFWRQLSKLWVSIHKLYPFARISPPLQVFVQLPM